MKISEVMNRSVVSCDAEESVVHAARLMAHYNVGVLPVCDADGRIFGLVTDRDIVLRCIADGGDPKITPVKEIMTRRVVTANPEDEVSAVADSMGAVQVRRVPVVHAGKVVGIVSLCDMARRSLCDMEASKAFFEISSNVKKK